MIIRPIRKAAARPLARLQRWTQTPTGCRNCDAARGLVGRVIGAPPATRPAGGKRRPD